MSTLIGHALAGAVTTRLVASPGAPRGRALPALAAVTALLPDLDIVVFLALRPLGMTPHRGLSHSLLFALASATIVALLASRLVRLPLPRLWRVLLLAASSHLLLDYLMGAGPPLQLLAPMSDRGFIFPWRVLPVAFYGAAGGAYLSPSFWTLNALAGALELLIFLPGLAVQRGGARGRRAAALAVSAGGLLLTAMIYN